jgi:chromosome segregation ATPase
MKKHVNDTQLLEVEHSAMNINNDDKSISLYDEIRNAVLEFKKNHNTTPTLRAVASLVARSTSTVQPYLKQIIHELGRIPPETEDELRPIMTSIVDFKQKAVAKAIEILQKDTERLQKDLDDTNYQLSLCENEKDNALKELASLESILNLKDSKLKDLENALADTKNELIVSRKQTEDVRLEMAKIKIREQDYIDAKAEIVEINEKYALSLSEITAKAAKFEGRLEEIDKINRQQATTIDAPAKNKKTTASSIAKPQNGKN